LIILVLGYFGISNTDRFKAEEISYIDEDADFLDQFPSYSDHYISPNPPLNTTFITLNVNPNITHVKNLVSIDEANFIIDKARSRFESDSPFNYRDGFYKNLNSFKGSNAYINKTEYKLFDMIEERVAKFLNKNTENIETGRVLRYKKGDYIKEHTDWVSKKTRYLVGGQRIITFIIYLTTMQEGEGGETNFPRLNITTRPIKGDALIWHNAKDDAGLTYEPKANHQGFTITSEKNEKWILTYFIKNTKEELYVNAPSNE